MYKERRLKEWIQDIHAEHQTVIACVVHDLFTAEFHQARVRAVCDIELHCRALFAAAIEERHRCAKRDPMDADLHRGVFRFQEIDPCIQVFDIMHAPVRILASALAMSAQIDHQDRVAHLTVDIRIWHAHGTVLVQTMQQDDGAVGSISTFDVRAFEPCTVL